MTKIIEVVRYKLEKGVTDSQVAELSDKLQKEVELQPGYIARRLAKSTEGEWVDLVFWNSLDDALNASNHINNLPLASLFMKLVNTESVAFDHYECIQEF
jgi:hypothetical protein